MLSSSPGSQSHLAKPDTDIVWISSFRAILRPRLKRVLDVVGATVLLAFLVPVLALLAVVVMADGGPVIFSHRRVGRHGREFGCLKFRTMRVDGDRLLREVLARDPVQRAEWEATRKLRDDPRVTVPGRILRATSLDELPQLLNVLRGEMSLVGPRPVVREELVQYYAPAGVADAYLAVRPGLTGFWQVNGRSDLGYSDRVALDASYVENLSLRTDIRILVRTLGVVLRRRGAY